MDQTAIDTKLAALDERIKAIETSLASLGESLKKEALAAVNEAVAKATQPATPPPQPEPQPQPTPPTEDQKARREKLIQLFKSLGLSETEATQHADATLNAVSPKPEPTPQDPITALAETVKHMSEEYNRRLEQLQELLLANQSKKLHLRTAPPKADDIYEGLPGANIVSARRRS